MSATQREVVRIGRQDIDGARETLRAVQRARQHEQLPHLVIVDPVDLALEPGMYTLIFDALRWINELLFDHPETPPSVTLRVPATEEGRRHGNLEDLLAASLPYNFKWWFTKIEPLPVPDEVDQ